jgi:hypothetical protein
LTDWIDGVVEIANSKKLSERVSPQVMNHAHIDRSIALRVIYAYTMFWEELENVSRDGTLQSLRQRDEAERPVSSPESSLPALGE